MPKGKNEVEEKGDLPIAVPKPLPPVEKLPPIRPEKDAPLLVCVSAVIAPAQTKVDEGDRDEQGNVMLHECMRDAVTVSFEAADPDPLILPRGKLVLQTTNVLPFEVGKKYSLTLKEMPVVNPLAPALTPLPVKSVKE